MATLVLCLVARKERFCDHACVDRLQGRRDFVATLVLCQIARKEKFCGHASVVSGCKEGEVLWTG